MKPVKLAIIIVLSCFSAGSIWFIGGVFYWWQALPAKSIILERQESNDIFAGLRGPGGNNAQDTLYAETLSPLLLYGLGLPTSECSAVPLRRSRLNLANPLVQHMRSKGMQVAYCKGNERTCWLVDSVLSSIVLRLKYSTRTLRELSLMLCNFRSIDNAFQDISGHSSREVSPEEAAVVSRWVSSPVLVENNSHAVESVQKRASEIAASCHKPYVPVASTEIIKLLSAIHDYREAHPNRRTGGVPD